MAGLLVLGGVAVGFASLFWGPPKEAGNRRGDVPFRRFTSSQECKDCHAALFEEWHGSHHQISYTNPTVRELSEDFRNKECQACHLPRPVLVTGIGNRPLQRMTRPEEGVDCLTCHTNAEGRIVGSRDVPSAGCKPVRDEQFLSVDLCKSCHNQHKTTDQYLASNYPKNGVSCASCHMPEVERPGGRKGKSHVFPGCHDAEFLRKAAKFRVTLDGSAVAVEVENDGAGHNFPTEERHRCVDVLYRFVERGKQGEEQPEFTRLYRFRQPYRGDPTPDTQLPAHATWKGRIELADATSGQVLQVRLIYKLTPLEEDRGTVLFEREIVVP